MAARPWLRASSGRGRARAASTRWRLPGLPALSPRASTPPPRRSPSGNPPRLPHHELGGPGELVRDRDLRRAKLRPRASLVPRRSRSGARPATPSATSVVPCRHARPNESLTITPTSTPASSTKAVRAGAARTRPGRAAGGRASRPRACSTRRLPAEAQTNPCRVSAITSGGRERTTSLLSRRITSTCRGSPSGPASSRRVARLDVCEPHDAPLDLRDGLLRDDDDVRVLRAPRALGGLVDEDSEIVALAELGSLEGDHADLARDQPPGHSPRPGRLSDAGDANAGVCLVALVHVHDHRGQPFERTGARERPAVDRAARGDPLGELEHDCLGLGVVAAHEHVLLRRLVRAEVPRGERVEAATTGPSSRSWSRAAIDVASVVGTTPFGVNASSAATESTGVVPIASRSSAAVSSVASAFVARTTRSAARAASAFVAPSAPSSAAAHVRAPRRASRSRPRIPPRRGAARARCRSSPSRRRRRPSRRSLEHRLRRAAARPPDPSSASRSRPTGPRPRRARPPCRRRARRSARRSSPRREPVSSRPPCA